MISFLRMFVFQALTIIIMPKIWGIEGVWCAIIVAEGISAIVAIGFVVKYKNKYRY